MFTSVVTRRGDCALAAALCVAVCAAAGTAACGKKGPPLPPLIKFPAAPTALAAERRGSTVDIQLTLPTTNTDGTRPADLVRVEVYGYSGSRAVAPEDVLRRGTKVATLIVNPPRDPDEEREQAQRTPARERTGIDQGAPASLKDELVVPSVEQADARSYIGVGFNKRGRRGALSRLAAVSLAQPPPPPSSPTVTYDETSITVTWPPPSDSDASATRAYHVYASPTGTVLTERPVTEPRYVDKRIEWGAERCYSVRTVKTIDGLSVESDLSGSSCVTLKDTFPPAPPAGLTAVASQGAISILWDASTAPDLAGYIVFRAIAPATELKPMTTAPIQETTFTDQLPSGARATYAVEAVDKAGNASALSSRIEETAR